MGLGNYQKDLDEMMTSNTTRVSRDLIDDVELCLSKTEKRNVPTICKMLKSRGIDRTDRAVRYALEHVIVLGRAKRIGRPCQRWWAVAI